ncbi:arginine--tRNA ligase [Microvenator marinus]|uniref:Arginine--tRNA ligase n=1 Tax=Microvenator marinus TaxID=2600177 RepID=A0A5B8XW10_9DELT|nr:arginine--tRNA ligase [Microvenator marinus]QED29361.1 arginine--tRNA ligase [Microvenator marinus]
MNVQEIEAYLNALKDNGLKSLGVDAETAESIKLAPSPNLEMGDVGFPCFALAKSLRKGPPQIAAELAATIQASLQDELVAEALAVGPYVNFRYNPAKLAAIVVGEALAKGADYGRDVAKNPSHFMVEYSAPNTNKPQHLGHVRNNLLGAAVSKILGFAGNRVTRVNLINDRGIHICKSMLAYKLFGEGETPESSGIKGDHLVGKYYVRFENAFQDEYSAWLETGVAADRFETWKAAQPAKEIAGLEDSDLQKRFRKDFKDTYFNTESSLGAQAREMLLAWEAGDTAVVELWKTMNSWVFKGFDQTYERLGVGFDKVYYESQTYLLGKDLVLKGLQDQKFKQLDDGAIVCDMEPLGLQGQKVLLRRDGTSVYMTQDLGTAMARFDEHAIDNMVYVVGDEQDYHFQVLFKILEVLRPELAGKLEHLSYGMVLLPEGKMKSREGKVVDADDLMDYMTEIAAEAIQERHEVSAEEVEKRAPVIGFAALKYFILDYHPRSSIQYDPAKSIEFEGRTGPYCLYSYARIQSIKRKSGGWPELSADQELAALSALGTELEMAVVRELKEWPSIVELAARQLDPSKVTEHAHKLAKTFSTLYNDAGHKVLEAEETRRNGLLLLAKAVAECIKTSLELVGIQTLDEM